MNQPSTPPPIARNKSSNTIILVWAILASVAAAFFALVALVLLFQSAKLKNESASLQIPVSVTVRQASLDNSLVAQLRNNSGSTLKVQVTIKSRTSDSKKAELVIAPNETTEIGWAEGWRFVSGESLQLHHPDYKDMTYTIP